MMTYQWLAFLAKQNNISIQHGRNIGEKHVRPYKLDRYYQTDKGENVALECHECFWHGCPTCYSRQPFNQVNNITMSDLYMRTVEQKKYIEEYGIPMLKNGNVNSKKT